MSKWLGDKPTKCECCGGAFDDGVFHDAPCPPSGSWGLICTACRGGGAMGQTYSLATLEKMTKTYPKGSDGELMAKLAKHKSRGHFIMSVERYNDMVAASEGLCISCGHTQGEVEPDGRKYECEVCLKKSVYGAEELLMMGRLHANPPKKAKLSRTEQLRYNLSVLPPYCYVSVEAGLRGPHQIAKVVRGERGYYELTHEEQGIIHGDPGPMNAAIGVTPAQAEAMKMGSMFGFDVPGADPAYYEGKLPAYPRSPLHTKVDLTEPMLDDKRRARYEDNPARKVVVEVSGMKYEVKVIDPTHVTMKAVGGTGTAWAYHVQQLSPDVCDQLREQKVMDERRYVYKGKERAKAFGNPPDWSCSVCGGPATTVSDWTSDICLDCVKARHKGVLTRRCSCGPKRKPVQVEHLGRKWTSCDRCLAPIHERKR